LFTGCKVHIAARLQQTHSVADTAALCCNSATTHTMTVHKTEPTALLATLLTTGSNGHSSTSFNNAKPKGVLQFDAIWDSNTTSATTTSSGNIKGGSGSNSNGETVIRRRYHLLHYIEDGTSELRR
jgi:hypothetical protein